MLIAVPQKLNFGLCLPGPRRETFQLSTNASYGTRRLKSSARLPWRRSKSRQRLVASRRDSSSCQKLQNNHWIGEKSRRGRLMPAALWGTRPW
jgi:hypothetical protein